MEYKVSDLDMALKNSSPSEYAAFTKLVSEINAIVEDIDKRLKAIE